MTKNIYQRINALLDEGVALEKTGKMEGGGGNYMFHQTDEVLSRLRPMLVRHGIGLSYTVEAHSCDRFDVTTKGNPPITTTQKQTEKTIKIRLTNVDNPEDYIQGTEVGYGLDSQDKGPGKATSYAIKTWLLNIFMLRGQPDEDGLESLDGLIGGKDLDDLITLIAETKSDEKKLLERAGAKSLEQIKYSQLGVITKVLQDRKAKMKPSTTKGE